MSSSRNNNLDESLARIKNDPTYTAIDLRDHYVDDEMVKLLAEALKENTSITSLSLERKNIGAKGAEAIADMLSVNKAISEIDLSHNPIGFEGAVAIGDALRTNRVVKSIKLTNCQLGDGGVQYLVLRLLRNEIQATFSLWGNDIGKRGAASFAKALNAGKLNDEITRLDSVRDNPSVIAVMLEHSNKVKQLDMVLGIDQDTGVVGLEILDALILNRSVTKLTLGPFATNSKDKNDIDGLMAPKLYQILEQNDVIRSIEFDHAVLGEQSISALAEGIKQNQRLKTIKGTTFDLEKKSFDWIAKALEENDSIFNADIENEDLYGEKTRYHFQKPILNRLFTCIKKEAQRVFWSFGTVAPLFLMVDLVLRSVIEQVITNVDSGYHINADELKLSFGDKNSHPDLLRENNSENAGPGMHHLNVLYVESLVLNEILAKAEDIKELRRNNRRHGVSSSSGVTFFNAPQVQAEEGELAFKRLKTS